jgi:hypothetical protein
VSDNRFYRQQQKRQYSISTANQNELVQLKINKILGLFNSLVQGFPAF